MQQGIRALHYRSELIDWDGLRHRRFRLLTVLLQLLARDEVIERRVAVDEGVDHHVDILMCLLHRKFRHGLQLLRRDERCLEAERRHRVIDLAAARRN